VQSRVVRPSELTEGELQAWDDLAARLGHPNPLFEPSCLIPAARYLSNRDRIRLAVATEDGRFYGCFPFQAEDRWRAIRRPLFTTQVRRMQYDGTPLIDPERGDEAVAALLDAVSDAGDGERRGFMLFDWVDEGPVPGVIERGATRGSYPVYRYHAWERPVVRRRETMSYRSDHGGKLLRNLGRLRRNLAKQAGADVRFVDRSDDLGMPNTLMRVEAEGYKGPTGVALLSHPGEPEWFVEMCDGFRKQGRLCLYTLEAGDQPIALQLFLRGDDGLFLLKLTFQEEFAHFRPGIQLHLDVIDHVFAETDVQWIDTCTFEGNETLMHLYPDRKDVVAMVAGVGGPFDRALLKAIRRARGAKQALHRSK